MDSYKFSELYNKLREAMNMTENEELKELLDKAIDSTLDMQTEVRKENENLSYLGIYTDDISNIIDICEDAVKSVGEDIDDYISIDYSGAENDTVTNAIIAEYLYQAESLLNETFEKNGLDIQADSYTNCSDSHLYAGDEEISSGEDIQSVVLTAVREKLEDTLEELGISADILKESENNPILGDDMEHTIQNIAERIAEEISGMEMPEITENNGVYEIELYNEKGQSIGTADNIGELGSALEEAVKELSKEQIEQD